MILPDTSAIIESLTGLQRLLPELRAALQRGERLILSTLVLYEWLRGPRIAEELALQEALLPGVAASPLGPGEARAATAPYRAATRWKGDGDGDAPGCRTVSARRVGSPYA